ncbi:KH domain-containing protein [bacterium]|nr:KH domain-containing protein [candidate division CSSED10-310 bacterium]
MNVIKKPYLDDDSDLKYLSDDEESYDGIDLGDEETFDDQDYDPVDGSVFEACELPVLSADPVTGEPRIEILVDQTISRAFSASEYLKGILLRMGLSGRIAVNVRHTSVHLEILGAEPGLVIGHRGQNLDALQHLINRMVNRDTDDLVPVTVDADNYRVRRHQQLEKLVRTVSREVIDSGKTIITDPMTPSERRLFHIAANKVRGVRTTSFGNGFFQPIKVFPAHLSNHSLYQDRDKDNGSGGYTGNIREFGENASENDHPGYDR